MGKNKAQVPTLARIRYMSCFDLTHAPVATTARAAATGPVSMSTWPDPEGSDTVHPNSITGAHSNQDLVWCVKIGVYMGFWVHRGSSLLTSYAPP